MFMILAPNPKMLQSQRDPRQGRRGRGGPAADGWRSGPRAGARRAGPGRRPGRARWPHVDPPPLARRNTDEREGKKKSPCPS